VDSRASNNLIPYSFFQKVGVKPTRSSTRNILLDRIDVKVIGETKDVLISLTLDPRIHQIISIVVVDVLK
jgi:hypothetical protein